VAGVMMTYKLKQKEVKFLPLFVSRNCCWFFGSARMHPLLSGVFRLSGTSACWLLVRCAASPAAYQQRPLRLEHYGELEEEIAILSFRMNSMHRLVIAIGGKS